MKTKYASDPVAAFTLIELMIVIAIVAILAIVAIPKMGDLLLKSKESRTKANLGTLRSSINIYYSDNEGFYPGDNLACLVSKYMPEIPECFAVPHHPRSSFIENNDTLGMGGLVSNDSGNWSYWNWTGLSSGGREHGDVWIGCTHQDSQGSSWTSF